MQITRVEANVRKSRIGRVDVDKLPKALRMRTVRLLNKLEGVKRINIESRAQDAIFELSDRNVTLDFFDRKLRREFVKTIDLLQWYQGPHWHSTPGVIGGPVRCTHCGYTRLPGFFSSYCPNSGYPSHEKWRQIIGPSYKPPENPLVANLERQIKELKKYPEGRKIFEKIGSPEKKK
jgi:hypothetical protein